MPEDKERSDETHLSTQQPGSQASAWFPCPYGDQGRAQDPECAPPHGPQETVGLIAMACVSGPVPRDMTLLNAGMAEPTGAAIAALAVSASVPIETLRKRADFLRAAKARRVGCAAFLIQARESGSNGPARIGFTCSKKIGNAVTRNRAKRRLRAVARAVLPAHAQPGWDYVLVGRPGATVTHDFAALCRDLDAALTKLHRSKG